MIIRDAIRELEHWGAGAVFSLTDYEDTNNQMIKLIKNWKDIFNEVRQEISKYHYEENHSKITLTDIFIIRIIDSKTCIFV